jgi:hypothetical protein
MNPCLHELLPVDVGARTRENQFAQRTPARSTMGLLDEDNVFKAFEVAITGEAVNALV